MAKLNLLKRNAKPNILVIITDQQRFPPCYENATIKHFRQSLKGQHAIAQNAVSFNNHYIAASACTPSRTSMMTGQYPSLHGITQTDGGEKRVNDPELYWLDPNTVPTMGNYFRAGGYDTFYFGKWHVSSADIFVPGTINPLLSNDGDGKIDREISKLYQHSDRLNDFGFSGWIGPEPHGQQQENAGYVRDPITAKQTMACLGELDRQNKRSRRGQHTPWLMVTSFTNPHDIGLWGPAWNSFKNAPDIPDDMIMIPPAPSARDDFATKPSCHKSYLETFPKCTIKQPTGPRYRQFYYYLHKLVDEQIARVYRKLKQTSLFDNTIVVLTSDHGSMLGAHGGMIQKWHNAYEETTRVPFYISNPHLFPQQVEVDTLSSHVDVLPTLLSFAGINTRRAQKLLAKTHSEARPLAGKALVPYMLKNSSSMDKYNDDLVLFTSDDEISKGAEQTTTIAQQPYEPVIQPNHIESIVVKLKKKGIETKWKYSRYWDPSGQAADEHEMYNLTEDPGEQRNLAHRKYANVTSRKIQYELSRLLEKEKKDKLLLPASGNQQSSTGSTSKKRRVA